MEQSPCPPTLRIYYVKRPDHLSPWAPDRFFLGCFWGANFRYADFISSGGLGSIMYSISEYKLVSVLQEVHLTRHRPCWRSKVGGEQRFRISIFQPWLLLKNVHTKQLKIFTERWTNIFSRWTLACFITLEAVLIHNQHPANMSMTSFVIYLKTWTLLNDNYSFVFIKFKTWPMRNFIEFHQILKHYNCLRLVMYQTLTS